MINKLFLTNFRNFESFELSNVSEGLNILIEPNGVGKTNLLESLAVLYSGVSPRTTRPREMIRWQQKEAVVRAVIGTNEYALNIKKNGRRFFLNKKAVDFRSYRPSSRIIFFQPSDLNIFFGSPSLKRRFLDRLIGQISFQYLYELNEYRSLLGQKNQLLKNSTLDLRLLDVLEDDLVLKAEYLFHARLQHTKKMNDILDDEGIVLTYRPSPRSLGEEVMREKMREKEIDYAGIMRKKMRELRRKEMTLGFSLIGPQRDDLLITARDINAPDQKKALDSFGSRGQQRLAVINLKLAEFRLLQDETGFAPLVLLDDVMSELDESNRKYLLDQVLGKQIVMTTTEKLPEVIELSPNVVSISR